MVDTLPGRRRARVAESAPARALETVGDQLSFYTKSFLWVYRALTRYRREVIRQLAAVTFGTGALALVGGTAVIVAFLTGAAGVEIALEGYSQLANIGVEAVSGFVSAYINTRISAPLIAGVALIATVGSGFTAELGAMRISDEVDALEVMAVPTVPYLVTTRLIAGFVAVTPLYAVSLFMSYALTRLTVVDFYGQSAGSYDHYFATFLVPKDILSSFAEVLVMSIVVMAVHCYYGYNASGGPAGVGRAVGRAVRLSLVGIMFVALAMSLILYGHSNTLHVSR
jgi:phospholipid/cholesterol/gamma-HCH transport system permease protein